MPSTHQESHNQYSADLVDGSLALIQSFADAGEIASREQAVAWLRDQGLLAADAGLMNSEYNALVRLRQALKDVLAAQSDGREDADAAARLTKGLADGRLVVTVDAKAAVELTTAARASYPTVVASLAVAIARAAAAHRWPGR
jgi:Putative stress-induced transcription regulator